jgi:hypothetical protein
MTPAPKRRWFQFSLRTLFVVVTVLCVWLAWNINTVGTRAAARARIEADGGQFFSGGMGIGGNIRLKRPGDRSFRLSAIRKLLGDEKVEIICFSTADAYYTVEMASPFPEADVY